MSLSRRPYRILSNLPFCLNQPKAHPLSTTLLKKPLIPSSSTTQIYPRYHKQQPLALSHRQSQPRTRTRTFTTTTPHLSSTSAPAAPLTTDQYHHLSDQYIDTLVAALEEMQEEREDVDVEYSVRVYFPCFTPLPPQPKFHLTTRLHSVSLSFPFIHFADFTITLKLLLQN